MADEFDLLEQGYQSSVASNGAALPDFDALEQNYQNQLALSVPLTPAEAATGAVNKVLNGLTFGYGDEIAAAGSALVDRVVNGEDLASGYDRKLGLVRDLDKRLNKQQFDENPALSILAGSGGLLMPIPAGLFTKEAGAVNALKNVGKAGALGGTIGGVAGFGSGEGVEQRVDNALTGSAIGALFGGGLQGGIEGASGAVRLGSSAANKARELFSPVVKQEAAQQEAVNVLSKVIDKDEALTALKAFNQADDAAPWIQKQSEKYLPQYQRTAEVTQQPGFASIEEALRRVDAGDFKGQATAQDLAREDARNLIYQGVNKEPLLPSVAGERIREGIQANYTPAKEKVGDFAERAFLGGEELSTTGAKRSITGNINALTKDGSISLTPDFQQYVNNFKQLPKKVDLETLQNYRRTFGAYASPGFNASNQDDIQALVATKLRGVIDDTVNKAVESGNLSAAQKNAWRNMIQERKAVGATYESKSVSKVLEKDRFGQSYKLAAEDVAPKLVETKEEAVRAMQALKGQHTSVDALRSSLMSKIWESSTNKMTGSINPTTFHKQLKLYQEIAPEVLTKAQQTAFSKIAKDVTSQESVKRMAFAASKGNSITSESDNFIDLLHTAVKENATSAVRKAISDIPFVGKMADSLINLVDNPAIRQKLLNEELAKVAMNPRYAEALLSKSPKVAKAALSQLSTNLNKRIEGISGTLGVASGMTGSAITKAKNDNITEIEVKGLPKSSLAEDLFSKKQPEVKKKDVSAIEQEIDQNPYYSALYEVESGRNPKAKNPKSTAKGAFQFIDDTAKRVGLKDSYDLGQSFEAVQKLTQPHAKEFGEDPRTLYAAHFLGATLLRKVLNDKPLKPEEEKNVKELINVALPRFEKIYQNKVA